MKKYIVGSLTLAALTMLFSTPALAQDKRSDIRENQGIMRKEKGPFGDEFKRPTGNMPFVVGTVTKVSGNTITITSSQNFEKRSNATTTYTVDATNAKIHKNQATTTISSISVGDTLAVLGEINGTNIKAELIRDGVKGGPGIGWGFGKDENRKNSTSSPVFKGNSQPIILGTISAINGSTISVTNGSTTYSVSSASSTKVLQKKSETNLSSLKIGDKVVVQGEVNGTSVSASTIIDQNQNGKAKGFFNGIGQFFKRLFNR